MHDGHLNVTCLHLETRQYWPNYEEHHISGLHPVMQEKILQHEKFTACLLLLHERLAKTMQEVLWAGKQEAHFVISCNGGCQRSVAMVCIMEAVLRKTGWAHIEVNHLHLRGCSDPYVPDRCCDCRVCQYSQHVRVDVVQSAYQQWRAVCC